MARHLEPADYVTLAGLALATLGAAFGGSLAGNAQIGGFVLALIGAFMGGRGALIFMTAALATGLWFAVESGANAMIEAQGGNARRFWRDWVTPAHFAASAAVIAVFLVGLFRRGDSFHDAAVETADDIETIVTWVGERAAWMFIPMMAFIFYDIVQRWIITSYPGFLDTIFYLQSAKMQEAQWHLHGALFMLVLGFAYIKDAHVRIELVRDNLSPRTRVWLELLGASLFLFAYCAILVRFGYNFAERSFTTGESSAAPTGLPYRWIIKSMLPLGFVLLGMTGVSAVLRCLVYLFGPERLKPQTSIYAGTHHADLPDNVKTQGPITD
jgi:TRAP-type mannitol/chloroaromatic compound transport system permease small subunit